MPPRTEFQMLGRRATLEDSMEFGKMITMGNTRTGLTSNSHLLTKIFRVY